MAREAGVSISTVSNAINGVNVLSAETRRRVLEVAARLNYTPDINGRNLKGRATNIIGMFIGEIRGPYYGELLSSIYEACTEKSYEFNIFPSRNISRIVTNILGNRIDGAIIFNDAITEKEEEMLLGKNIPVVYIDRDKSDANISSVIFDSYTGGEEVAKYLLELGNRSFMVVRGPEGVYDSIERERGFTDVLRNAGIEIGEDYFLDGLFETDAAYHAVLDFIEAGHELPDAIFALNDLSAIGVVGALKEYRIAVPDRVSVVGCDDIDASKLITPSLTTIRTNFRRQGSMAVEQLVKMINGEEGRRIVLNGRIIPRESTMRRE